MAKAIKMLFALGAMYGFIAACSSGGGSGNCSQSGSTCFTHSELAEIFVERAFEDEGFDLTLIKSNTLQGDFIVAYDNDTGEYIAFDLFFYNPGEDIFPFLVSGANYYNLWPDGFGYYEAFDGTLFEKQDTDKSEVNMDHAIAVFDQLKVFQLSKTYQRKLGLLQGKAHELATKTVQFARSDKSPQDVENFLLEVTGKGFSAWQNASKQAMSGDKQDILDMAKGAASMWYDDGTSNAEGVKRFQEQFLPGMELL